MHELSLMEALGERVLAVAALQAAERVTAIQLRIGSLAGVDPEALRFAAEVVFAQTCAEGATLEIEVVPAAFWCQDCGRDVLAPEGWAVCPGCGRPCRKLLQGRELTLHAVELHP
ncbi:MAG: hydrogenase maturation nickel metallochaperone HypA [Cyanobacteriota bacterium]|nr:hydrogenase maturation nickel metallochaperone HypA [Cyanobacteriota bacterium]